MVAISFSDRKSTPLNSNLPSSPPRRSSDLPIHREAEIEFARRHGLVAVLHLPGLRRALGDGGDQLLRSEEHTSELQSTLFPSPTLFRSSNPPRSRNRICPPPWSCSGSPSARTAPRPWRWWRSASRRRGRIFLQSECLRRGPA